jgi:hypothetical protein
VEHHPRHLAAAHRHRHGQRTVGQRRVVALAQGEPQHPAGSNIEDRDQVQPALIGGDLGAVTEPLAVELAGREVSLAQVRGPPPAPAWPGVALRFFLRRAARPSSRISAATVFWLTRHPASRRSAVILGEPYLPSCTPNRRVSVVT